MLIGFFVGLIGIIVLDQLTKYFVVVQLKHMVTHPVLQDVFHFTYVENTGAGFGIFADYTWLLSAFSVLVVVGLVGYMIIKKPTSPLFVSALTFLCGGALGNLIDRVRLGYVVDFLDMRIIHFPVFNIADCFITVGAVLLAVYIVFFTENTKQSNKTDEKE